MRNYDESQPGDGVMIYRKMTDRITGEGYTWKFLAVVVEVENVFGRNSHLRLYRLVPSKKGEHEFVTFLGDKKNRIVKLDPDRWPDGLHQVRMHLILTGQIDI